MHFKNFTHSNKFKEDSIVVELSYKKKAFYLFANLHWPRPVICNLKPYAPAIESNNYIGHNSIYVCFKPNVSISSCSNISKTIINNIYYNQYSNPTITIVTLHTAITSNTVKSL